MTSIGFECSTGDLNALKKLLPSPTINTERDKNGNLPLHVCAEKGFTKGVELLLAHGADINLRNNDGKTPLYLAAASGYLHCVEILVKNNADKTITDNQGKTALDVVDTTKGGGCKRLLQGEVTEKKSRTHRGGHHSVPRERTENTDHGNVATRPFVNTMFYTPDNNAITVVSYNILAIAYTKPNYFPYASQEVLSWEFRYKNLVRELTELNADVLCLQEVDMYEQLRDALHPLGYSSVFLQRTGRRKDGCATFYKSFKLTLVKETLLCFNDFCTEELRQDNVALFLQLQKKDGESLFIGNTHLYYKDERVKRQQASDIVREAKKLSDTNVLICGDYNTSENSFVYNYMHEQGLQSLYHQNEIKSVANSICPYTSFGGRPLDLDYIFASPDVVPKTIQVMRLPDKRLALPNHYHSSDHVPIAVTIKSKV
jgi:endonuclease/exonuclease/phosphatase family metal-dependent hydrolase